MNKTIIYFDRIGRTLMGEVINTTDNTITVKNPCVFQIQQVQRTPNDKEFNIQLLPITLFEVTNIHETKSYNIEYDKKNIEILTNEDGSYVKPSDNFIKIREGMFGKLSDGTFEKMLQDKNLQSNNSNSQPETIEVK